MMNFDGDSAVSSQSVQHEVVPFHGVLTTWSFENTHPCNLRHSMHSLQNQYEGA